MNSINSGRTYRIYIYEPRLGAPPGGYPVVYVTDGNSFFGAAALQVDMLEDPLMVVGIGYPGECRSTPEVMRLRDLTWNEPEPEIREEHAAYLGSENLSYGGAEEYLRFITEELQPAVAATYEINRAESTIFGYSLGGLFVLHALFRYPEKFATYVAGSPSIWWNDRDILGKVSAFRARVESREVTPRVLMTVGSLEESADGLKTPRGMTREEFERKMRAAKMVENVRNLALELETVRGAEGYLTEYRIFDGETHQSVVPATIGRAIAFSLENASAI